MLAQRIISRGQISAGIGIKTGQGLVAIDADAPTEENARIIRDAVERHLGGALPIRVGRYPKALYLCRVTDPYSYTRIEFGPRNDRASGNRQNVSPHLKKNLLTE